MIKAWYGPATEDLVEQLLSNEGTGSFELDSNIRDWQIAQVIEALKAHGYQISVEVEVHGDMAKALESLGGDTSNYVARGRPERHT